jgi:hypothetical protein
MLPKLASIDDPVERRDHIMQELQFMDSESTRVQYLDFLRKTLKELNEHYEVRISFVLHLKSLIIFQPDPNLVERIRDIEIMCCDYLANERISRKNK